MRLAFESVNVRVTGIPGEQRVHEQVVTTGIEVILRRNRVRHSPAVSVGSIQTTLPARPAMELTS